MPVTTRLAFAVCPRIEQNSATRIPKLFRSESAANRFLNSEVQFPLQPEAEVAGLSIEQVRARRAESKAQLRKERAEAARKIEKGDLDPLAYPLYLRKILNRDQAWQDPVPVSRASDYSGPKCNRTLQAFLPLDAVGAMTALSVDEIIDRALEGRSEDYMCYLDTDWQFEAIEADAWRRVGHEYSGRRHGSIGEIVVKAIYDVEAAFHKLHPNAACRALAAFWRSWQLQQHIAEFCARLGESETARLLAGSALDAPDQAERARLHMYRQLAVFGHELAVAVAGSDESMSHAKDPLGSASQTQSAQPEDESRRVFVVYGRNLKARDAMFSLLRAVDLDPIEWNEAVSFTGEGSPFNGQVIEKAFSQARAVVVLITGDDLVRLGSRFQTATDAAYEKQLTPQARPNVLFEAGMAFGRHPERTILVTLGDSRPFSDVAGRNVIRISNKPEDRHALVGRLKNAGCPVKTKQRVDWLHAGDFDGALLAPDLDFNGGDSQSKQLDTVDEDVQTFKEVRQMLRDNQMNTWAPEIGSKDDTIAERLVARGWLSRGPLGGYMIRRFV